MAIAAYIYYTQQFAGEILNFSKLLEETKESILISALKNEIGRAQRLTEGLSDSDRVAMEQYLSGSWIGEFNKNLGNINSAAEVVFPETYEAAIKLIEEAEKKNIKNQEFVSALEKFLNTVENEYGENLEAYVDDTVRFFSQRGTGTANNKNWSTVSKEGVAKKIINTLFSKYEGKGFQLKNHSNTSRVNGSLKRLAVLAKEIPDLPTMPSDGKRIPNLNSAAKGVSNREDFWDNAYQKIIKWTQNFISLLAEVAVAEGYFDSNFIAMQGLQNLHKNFTHTGAKGGITVTLTEDTRLKEMLKKLAEHHGGSLAKISSSFEGTVTYKADVSQTFITGENGFTVKDYETNSISLDGAVAPYSIHTQSSTPLLTYLLRECGYTLDDIHLVLNLGASLPKKIGKNNRRYADNSSEEKFASNWTKFIDLIKYKGFLATVAGLDNTVDQSHFGVFNGKVVSIADMISSLLIQVMENNNKISSIDFKVDGEGLQRSTYQTLNDSHYLLAGQNKGKKIWELAHDRSEAVYPALLDVMYSTKINTSISLTQLYLLTK